MIPIFGELTLLWLGLTVAAGFVCVRMLEGRDLRKLAHQQREQLKRQPQMRLF